MTENRKVFEEKLSPLLELTLVLLVRIVEYLEIYTRDINASELEEYQKAKTSLKETIKTLGEIFGMPEDALFANMNLINQFTKQVTQSPGHQVTQPQTTSQTESKVAEDDDTTSEPTQPSTTTSDETSLNEASTNQASSQEEQKIVSDISSMTPHLQQTTQQLASEATTTQPAQQTTQTDQDTRQTGVQQTADETSSTATSEETHQQVTEQKTEPDKTEETGDEGDDIQALLQQLSQLEGSQNQE